MRWFTGISLLLCTLLLVSISSAQQASVTSVPNLIRYGGTLKNAETTATSSATVGVTFSIYKQQDGGAPAWMETQNVTTDTVGNYSVLLGSTTATGLPSNLFSQEEQRWLGVQVQGQAEQPRVLLVSVPYAFKAHEAETLAGKSISDFVLAKDLNSSQAATGAGSGHAGSSAGNNLQAAKAGIKTAAASAGPTNFSGTTTDQIVKVTQTGTGNAIVATTLSPGSSNGVLAGIQGPGVAIFGQAYSTSAQAYGVEGTSASTVGIGLLGFATATTGSTYGLKGYSSSISGTGVRGLSTATTGSTVGISASVASPTGIAGVFNNAAGGKIISGQNNGAEKFSVDGSGNVNTVSTYKIGGTSVVNIGSSADDNLFLGVGAGTSNVAGTGTFNTFSGFDAGHSNTTGHVDTFVGWGAGYNNTTGYLNTFFGAGAGYSNTSGTSNTFVGEDAGGYNTIGSENAFYGSEAGLSNTTGGGNSFLGSGAGLQNTTGVDNTFTGFEAGYSNATGLDNVFVGAAAGYSNTTGEVNTFLGNDAGFSNTTAWGNVFVGHGAGGANTIGFANSFVGEGAGGRNISGSSSVFTGSGAGDNSITGSYDIYIGNVGPTSGNESNAIRLGFPYSTDPEICQGQGGVPPCGQNVAYVAGIYGSTSASGLPVYVNSDGLLGTLTSSLRFKEQVRDMGGSSSRLFQLRPVTFFYKPQYDDGAHLLQYGLIAEEVAKVYPDVVVYDKDDQPYTVKYQYLAPMLLNELQKQHTVVAAQQDVIKTQQEQIESLQNQNTEFQKRLLRLESLIGR